MTQPPPEIVLYGYWRSSSTWRVRIALAFKGLKCEVRPVHLLRGGGEHRSEQHQRLNPMMQVPVLVVDGEPLTQSAAIVEYLEDRFPLPGLFPGDCLQRARTREVVEVINSGIQPIQNLRVLQKLAAIPGAGKEGAQRWAADAIVDGFQAVEALVVRNGRSYCSADVITAAEVFLVPQVYNARRFGVDMAAFPGLSRVEALALEHPAFFSTRPELQPDAES